MLLLQQYISLQDKRIFFFYLYFVQNSHDIESQYLIKKYDIKCRLPIVRRVGGIFAFIWSFLLFYEEGLTMPKTKFQEFIFTLIHIRLYDLYHGRL